MPSPSNLYVHSCCNFLFSSFLDTESTVNFNIKCLQTKFEVR